jgi:hypothetical protein
MASACAAALLAFAPDASAEVSDELPIAQHVIGMSATSEIQPALAFDGTSYLAVWSDDRSGAWQLFGSHLSPAGDVLDPGGFLVLDRRVPSPAMAFGAGEHLLVFAEGTGILGLRLAPDGSPIDASPFSIASSPTAGAPSVVFEGTTFIVVWRDQGALYGVHVNTDGTAADSSAALLAYGDGFGGAHTAVALGGGMLWLAWEHQDGIQAGRFRPDDLAPLDSAPIEVASGPGYDSDHHSSVACTDTFCVVGWAAGYGLLSCDVGRPFVSARASRLSLDGTVLDPGGWELASCSVWLDVDFVSARSGNSIAAAFSCSPAHCGFGPGLTLSRIDETGVPESAAVPYDEGDRRNPILGSDPGGALVLWQDSRSVEFWDIYSQRVEPGALPSTDGTLVSGSTAPNPMRNASSAFGGDTSLIVWEDFRNGRWQLYGGRMEPDGNLLDGEGLPIDVLPRHHASPRVAFDGQSYLVVWMETGIGLRPLGAVRVGTDGSLLDASSTSLFLAEPLQVDAIELAFDGGFYRLAWHDPENTEALTYATHMNEARLDATGRAVDGYSLREAGVYESEGCVAGGTGSAAVGFVAASVFSPSPAVIEACGYGWDGKPTGGAVTIAPAGGAGTAMAYDGSRFVLISASSDPDLQRFAASSIPFTNTWTTLPLGPRPDGAFLWPRLAFDGISLVSAWGGVNFGSGDQIWVGWMSPGLGVASPLELAASTPRPEKPALASFGLGRTLLLYARIEQVGAATVAGVAARILTTWCSEGVPCDDGDPCTEKDACFNGSCRGYVVQCPAADCREAGQCDPTTGQCVRAVLGDGAPCTGGTCSGGDCIAEIDAGPDGSPADAADVDATVTVDASEEDTGVDAEDDSAPLDAPGDGDVGDGSSDDAAADEDAASTPDAAIDGAAWDSSPDANLGDASDDAGDGAPPVDGGSEQDADIVPGPDATPPYDAGLDGTAYDAAPSDANPPDAAADASILVDASGDVASPDAGPSMSPPDAAVSSPDGSDGSTPPDGSATSAGGGPTMIPSAASPSDRIVRSVGPSVSPDVSGGNDCACHVQGRSSDDRSAGPAFIAIAALALLRAARRNRG